jgi:predicted metal-dependent hydrolase
VAVDPRFQEGLKLFRARRYFEAHEVWESLWHETRGPERSVLQGFIQGAVCLHHAERGNRRGADYLYKRCAARLSAAKGLWGVNCSRFLTGLRRRLASLASGVRKLLSTTVKSHETPLSIGKRMGQRTKRRSRPSKTPTE